MIKKHVRFPWLWILGICIAAAFVLWPLAHRGFYVSDDGEWMVIRLSAFYQSLVSGQFPVRLIGRLNNSYGYPVSNFLYPGFLYIGSLFHILGLSFPNAVKCIMGVSVIGSALLLFFSLRYRFRPFASFVGAISFLVAPYLLFDLYRRGSVGEILALLPASLLMFGLSSGMYWLIPPAMAFLIVAHNTTALLFGAVFVGMLFTYPRPYRFIPHVILGIGISAFFWVPALFEQSFVRFNSTVVSDPNQYFVSVPQAMLLGIPTLLCLAFALNMPSTKRKFDWFLIFIVVAGYFMALPISAFIWNIPILTKVVQFPYRFLILPVVLGPWVVARAIEGMIGWKRAFVFVVCIGLWVFPVAIGESSIEFVDRPIGYYTTNEATTTVADEYMPVWVSDKPKTRSLDTIDVVSGDANLSVRRFSKETINTIADVKEGGIVQINKIYYPGWGVTIDGVRVPIDYQNAFGFMRISVPTGVHEIHAAFRETPERFIADMMSVISVIFWLVFIRRFSLRA